MVFNKIKTLAQVIGFATMALLALNGGLAMLGGDLPLGAALRAPAAPAAAQAPPGAPTLSSTSSAVVPVYLNYQGTLRNAEGNPLSGTYDMTFRIYADVAAAVGSELWSEDHISVTVRSGHFSVLLGNTEPFSPTLFTDPDRFIGVTVHPYDEMVPRQRFATVPYAIQAVHATSLRAPDGDPRDAVFVDSAGNVGIGTTSPEATLDVAGNQKLSIGEGLEFLGDNDYFSTNADARVFRMIDWNGSSGVVDGGIAIEGFTPLDGVRKPIMAVRGSGNVGIGTASPASKLHVSGGSVTVSNSGDEAVLLNLASERSWEFRQEGSGASTALKLKSVDGGGNKNFVIETEGNIGIGTTTPGAKLDVNGDVRIQGDLKVGGNDTVHGAKPIKIIRYENKWSGDFSTGVSFADYYCVTAGWSTFYDIDETDSHTNMVWTYVVGSTWRVRVLFASHNNHENPDVDVVCFRREIASWEGASAYLIDPD